LPDPSPILTDASVALVEALDAPTATWPIQTSLTLQSSGKPALDCTIQAQLESSGLLVFDVSNTLPAAARKKTVYTLRIVFASNVRRIASDALSDTEDTVVTWTFHSLKKIRAYEETTP